MTESDMQQLADLNWMRESLERELRFGQRPGLQGDNIVFEPYTQDEMEQLQKTLESASERLIGCSSSD